MSNVTFYNNTFGKENIDVELESILDQIQRGKWAAKVKQYRNAVEKHGKKSEQAEKIKKNVPCFTTSGTFPKERKANQLGRHSGLIAIDFDDVDLSVRDELYADDYTMAGFVSISGGGICIIVKIEGDKHLEAFKSLEHYYFTKYNLQIDQSCKDVNRLRFISHDPDMQINLNSHKWATYLQKKKGRKPTIKPIANTDDDIELVLRQIEADRADLTANYDDWVQIGMSIASKYGQSAQGLEIFQRVSQFHSNYDPEKTASKYKSFGSPSSKIGIATFFYHAKQAGFQIKSSQTKTIETVAKYAKKGRRKPEQAIQQLKEIDNIPEEKSREIVNQVFSGDIDVDVDDSDIVHEVEEFLRRECEIRFNEITLKYETKGEPMTDRDFNSFYLNCKKIVPKVTKDLFLSCIDSDRTPVYNPIKEFFTKYGNRKPKGLIKKLANCITTPTGYNSEANFPDYCEYFIRKWMLGAVAMWTGKHSPLMLVLAGDIQNTGKSHFFRYLLPNELQPYYAEAELTGDKDENLLMCTKIIMMNDEMSNKSKRDITVLKKLCSTKWFNLRKPYGKLSEDFRRLSALAGTSNSLELLNDPTGNRRIIPVEVMYIDHKEYNDIDKIDLWIEAYQALQSGETFELSNEDIKRLNLATSQFEEASLEGELLTKFFEPDGLTEMTNSEIKYFIEVRTNQRLNQRKLGMELKRFGFQKKMVKRLGKMRQVYSVKTLVKLSPDEGEQAPF